MFKVTKKFKVEYAHQLKSAYMQQCCDTIHGHNGVIEICIKSENLNIDDMVVDFGKMDDLISEYINDKFDHTLIMPSCIPEEYITCISKYNKKIWFVKGDRNPTAEYFSEMIFKHVEMILKDLKYSDSGVYIHSVTFYETDDCYSEYSYS